MAKPVLVPPVQLIVRCTACSYERTVPALTQYALDAAHHCEKCSEPNRILGYRPMHERCTCCML